MCGYEDTYIQNPFDHEYFIPCGGNIASTRRSHRLGGSDVKPQCWIESCHYVPATTAREIYDSVGINDNIHPELPPR